MALLNRCSAAPYNSTYLDLDLGPPVPSATLGDELSPSGTVTHLASSWMPLPLTPISRISSANVSRHVRFGLPRLRLPPSEVQSNTKLAGLDVRRRNICPMNLLRLVATVSCRSPTPAFCRSSSFVIWSFHDTPSMSCRHLLLNTLSILFVLSVVLHVSLQPYSLYNTVQATELYTTVTTISYNFRQAFDAIGLW